MSEIHQRVEAVVAAFAKGEIVVVADDDDRENEGDLFIAASLCSPERMAFIIRHTSGIVCAPLAQEEAKRLHLDPMVAINDAPLGTAFTVSVDVRHGLTTGISAEERTNTVRALANHNSGATNFARPGHVFPLVAKEGGVLMRSGHTEACVDLCRLAGLPPVGVLAELMNDDGTVMRGAAVSAFAETHKLQRISIADLIDYRQARDKLVKRIGEFPVESEIGTLQGYAYVTPFDAIQHMAFVYGRLGDGEAVLARLHRADVIRDLFGGASPVHASLRRFKKEGRGVLVFLRDGAAGVPTHQIPQAGTRVSEEARSRQWREVGLGAQILKDLGISSIRLLTGRKFTYVGLAGFGIEIHLGVLLVFLGVSVLGRTIALPLSRAIGAPLPRVKGVTGTLARQNTMRNPKRTAASASALMIGVGLIAFISIFASSSKASIDASIDRSFTGDFVIDSGGGQMGGVVPALGQRLNTLPQVAAATGKRLGSMEILGTPTMIAAVDPRTAGQIFNVNPLQGSIGALGADGIAVYSGDATKNHLKLGDPVSVVFRDTGPKTLRVALIYGDNLAAPSAFPGSKTSYFLGTPAYDANFAAPHFDSEVYVKKAPGVSTAAALTAVKTLTAQYAVGATVQDESAYKAAQTKPINQILALIYTLLALAIVIALIGIGNTLALSIFERTRELGVMRAVGMTRGQLRSTIRWESVITALQGTLLGLLVGVFFGWALVRSQNSSGLTVFSLPYATLLIIIVLAGLAGVAAAILPSRRAAKLNVLRAIVTE